MLLRQWNRSQLKPTEFISDILENRLPVQEVIAATECIAYVADVALALQAILQQLKHPIPLVREAAISALRVVYVSHPDFVFSGKIRKKLKRMSRKDPSPTVRKAARSAGKDLRFKGKENGK